MNLEAQTIDSFYLLAVAMGDVILAGTAVLILAAMVDFLVSGLQLLNRGD